MKRVLLACIILASLTVAGLADDKFPPGWRGQPGTVVAEWDRWAGYDPAKYADKPAKPVKAAKGKKAGKKTAKKAAKKAGKKASSPEGKMTQAEMEAIAAMVAKLLK